MKPNAEEILLKYCDDCSHPKEVVRLSRIIVDEISSNLKKISDEEKKYLEIASLLHDIGYSIAIEKHNKHSQNLIIKNGIDGFSSLETEIIACICRYHRGGLPNKDKHEIYKTLDKKDRKTVKRLAGILRIADGLDCAHLELIKDIKLHYDGYNNIVEFIITPHTNGQRTDITCAVKKKDLFETAFKCQCVFKFSHN